MAMRGGREAGIWGKEERDGRHRHARRKEERGGRSRYERRDSESSSSFMKGHLERSTYRFALSISSIVEKYNFPFEDDKLISIKSLMYDTSDGPKAWGEESEEENINDSDEASKNLSEEEQSTNSYEESPSGTDFKNDSEMSSIKRYLKNLHLKENVHLVCHSGAEMDMLVNDDAYTVSETTMILRQSKNVREEPFQELVNESLHGYRAVVPRKQGHNGHSESMSLQSYNSTAKDSADEIVASGNLALWDSEKTGSNSFLETYESADERCSWNNITIADLYPEMVKTLSRLMHKMPHKASSRSQIKRYGFGYCHPKKTNVNTATERVRKFKPLKHNRVLAITKENEKCKLPMENSASNRLLGHGNNQMHHTFISESSVTSPISRNADEMKMDSSDTEDYSYVERVGRNGNGATIFPNNLSGRKIFHLKSPSWIPSSSEHARKGQHFEEHSAVCPDDPGATFDLTEGDEPGITRIMSFKAPAYLNLPLNRNTNPPLQANKSSPLKSPCRLFRNHEIKIFPTTGSLRRSQSFSQFLVNHSRIKVQQKSEDAFEKMYKELCCPQVQKSSDICTNPTQSGDKLLKPELSNWTRFHQKHNKSGIMYVRSRSEGFPKISTFLRAARLKKYEGVQVSHTVNALVNSPVRTLPTVARIKRTANFSNEDFLSSPVKRLKNISESFSSGVHQKLPYLENINLDKTGMTLTLHSPNSSNWPSKKLDSEFRVSPNRTFLVGPSTYMHESGIADDYEYIPKLLQSCDALKRMQNSSRRASKKLNYNERRARDAYMGELVCKNYQRSFSEGCEDEMS
ncbi:PREDICTED: Holliday junction recognition protein [Gekko japonicus]|uniref:Holliday junction recognition protein n=1 Tax=Gekko japonicus TaxID=146911 RepID=A0ABM1LA34_GEKJA|nr:PREDICTED: Holliday junction recognition protein [Gekko japonicus]